MKKIIIIIPDISEKGGTERAVVNLANLLCSDYQVEILSLYCPKENTVPFYPINANVLVSSFGLEKSGTLANFYKSNIYIRKYLKEARPHYVIGTWYGINILLPYITPHYTKTIGCEHADYSSLPKFVKRLASLTYPKLQAVVALSESAKNKIPGRGYVIPNSLPFEVADKNGSFTTFYRILMVGRLVPVKAYHRIVSLAKFLKEKYINWKIEIYGDGELKSELSSLFESEGLDNVVIAAPVKDIRSKYLKSDIFISTSLHEAMPMVFLEAFSCGIPVVSYDNEGSQSLVLPGGNGFIVSSEEELSSAVQYLIENPEIRKKMGQFSINTAMSYSPENIKKLWIALLKEI